MNIELRNLKQNGKPIRIVGADVIGHPMILVGKMKRPDTMSWSAWDNGDRVALKGLWRSKPSYGQAIVDAQELNNALIEGGFAREASELQRARAAWKS